jgi:hypothetical protein
MLAIYAELMFETFYYLFASSVVCQATEAVSLAITRLYLPSAVPTVKQQTCLLRTAYSRKGLQAYFSFSAAQA